jgi:hypothetical protein
MFWIYDAPQGGIEVHERAEFFERLQEMRVVIEEEGLIVGGEINGHVDHEDVLECYGMGDRNEQGEAILDFSMSGEMKVANISRRIEPNI